MKLSGPNPSILSNVDHIHTNRAPAYQRVGEGSKLMLKLHVSAYKRFNKGFLSTEKEELLWAQSTTGTLLKVELIYTNITNIYLKYQIIIRTRITYNI